MLKKLLNKKLKGVQKLYTPLSIFLHCRNSLSIKSLYIEHTTQRIEMLETSSLCCRKCFFARASLHLHAENTFKKEHVMQDIRFLLASILKPTNRHKRISKNNESVSKFIETYNMLNFKNKKSRQKPTQKKMEAKKQKKN